MLANGPKGKQFLPRPPGSRRTGAVGRLGRILGEFMDIFISPHRRICPHCGGHGHCMGLCGILGIAGPGHVSRDGDEPGRSGRRQTGDVL
ncbi:MAG: hypothetical protein LBR22_07335 [Desulfovibrio sp.]|jgi:hypothetical protein|nr:hypothetical protein [Desulfovibrio sp.]